MLRASSAILLACVLHLFFANVQGTSDIRLDHDKYSLYDALNCSDTANIPACSRKVCNGNGVFQVIGALLDMPYVCYASDARGYWAGEYCEKRLPGCDPASNCTQCVEYEDWVSIKGVVQQLVDAVQVLSSNVSTLQSAIAGNAHDIRSLLANDAVLTRWFSAVLGAPAEFWQAATTGESRELGAINSKFCVLSASRMAAYQGTGFDFTCRLTAIDGQWTLQSSSSGPNLTIVCESLCWTLPQF
eukprot:ANDGO_01325.mRNA.1 hypothetical protein